MSAPAWAPNSLTEPGRGGAWRRGKPAVAFVAVVPAEIEVRVGAVELGKVGEHPRVGDGGSRAVGLFDRAFHGTVEDGAVPGGQLLFEREARRGLAEVEWSARLEVDLQRLVVAAPDGDRRMVGEQIDHLARLAHGLLTDAAGVTPLEGEVLPEQETGLVRGRVQLRTRDMRVYAEEIEPGFLRERDVARQLLARGLGEGHARRPRFEPFKNRRAPFTVRIQSAHRHASEAGAGVTDVAHLTVELDWTVTSYSGCAPNDHGPPEARFVDGTVQSDLSSARRREDARVGARSRVLDPCRATTVQAVATSSSAPHGDQRAGFPRLPARARASG